MPVVRVQVVPTLEAVVEIYAAGSGYNGQGYNNQPTFPEIDGFVTSGDPPSSTYKAVFNNLQIRVGRWNYPPTKSAILWATGSVTGSGSAYDLGPGGINGPGGLQLTNLALADGAPIGSGGGNYYAPDHPNYATNPTPATLEILPSDGIFVNWPLPTADRRGIFAPSQTEAYWSDLFIGGGSNTGSSTNLVKNPLVIDVTIPDFLSGAAIDISYKYHRFYWDPFGGSHRVYTCRCIYFSPLAGWGSPSWDGQNWTLRAGARAGGRANLPIGANLPAGTDVHNYVNDFQQHPAGGFSGLVGDAGGSVSSFEFDVDGAIFTQPSPTLIVPGTVDNGKSFARRPRVRATDSNGIKSSWNELHIAPVPRFLVDEAESPILALDASPSYSPISSPLVEYSWNPANTTGLPTKVTDAPNTSLDYSSAPLGGFGSENASIVLRVKDADGVGAVNASTFNSPNLWPSWKYTISVSLSHDFDVFIDATGALLMASKSGPNTLILRTRTSSQEKAILARIIDTQRARIAKSPHSQRLVLLAQKLVGAAKTPGKWQLWRSDRDGSGRDGNPNQHTFTEFGMSPFSSEFSYSDFCFLPGDLIAAVGIVKNTMNLVFRLSPDAGATWKDAQGNLCATNAASQPATLIALYVASQPLRIESHATGHSIKLQVALDRITHQWVSLDTGRNWKLK